MRRTRWSPRLPPLVVAAALATTWAGTGSAHADDSPPAGGSAGDAPVAEAPEIIVRPPPADRAPSARALVATIPGGTGVLDGLVTAPTDALSLTGGPSVPITRGGAKGVLSPRDVHELTPTSVQDVANKLPGVSARLYSGDEHLRPSWSMRGMPDNGFTEYTAVLVNGINYSTLAYGWTSISIFPFTSERIWAAEVYRGAESVRYGPNTIGGVINLLTWPIPEKFTARSRTVLGSNRYHSELLQVGGTDPRSGVGVLATYVDKGGDTWRQNNDFRVTEGAVDVSIPTSCNSWLRLSGFTWEDWHAIPLRLTQAQYDTDRTQNPIPREVDWNGYAYGGDATWHVDLSSCSWLEAFTYYRDAHRELEGALPGAGPPFASVNNGDSDSFNLGVGVRGQTRINACNSLYYGARFHREWIDRWQFTQPLGGGAKAFSQNSFVRTSALAAHVDDTLTLGRWTLQGGARAEWLPSMEADDEVTGAFREFDMFTVLPGVSVSYAFTPCFAAFGNYFRSMRPPQTFSIDFVNPNQRLDYEEGTNAEVGLRWQGVKGLSGELCAWRIDYSDFIEQDPATLIVTNYGGYESRGLDLTLRADLGAWSRALCGLSAYGSVTKQDSEFTVGANAGKATQFVPPWIASFGARYEHRSGAYAALDGNWKATGWANAANTLETPGYAVFNGRAGYRQTWCLGCGADAELDVAVAVKNLFDRETYLRHTTSLIVPGAPQEVFAELSLAFRL